MKRGVAYSLALAVAVACLAGPARAQDGKVRDVDDKGLKIQGTVEGTDNRVEVVKGGKRLRLAAKVYPVRLQGGAKYRIEMVSNDLDAFLAVQDSAGKQLAFDDDGGGNLNAKLVFTPPADGTYKVCAASFRLVGQFTLTVAREGAAGQQKAPAKVSTEPQAAGAQPAGGDKGKILSVGPDGLRLTGKLSEDDKRVEVGSGDKQVRLPAKLYVVRLKAGTKYRLEMKSPTLDSFLLVQTQDGKPLAFDDDSGGGANKLDAKLDFTPPKDGTYRVYAASNAKETKPGDFVLTIRAEGGGAGKALTVGPKGLKVEGEVAQTDKLAEVVDGDKRARMPAKLYLVQLQAGTKYRLEMRSPDIDSFLIVQDADGKQLAYDDDTGQGANMLDALLDFTPPKTGTYKIYAGALQAGAAKNAGKFTLTIRPEGGGKEKKGDVRGAPEGGAPPRVRAAATPAVGAAPALDNRGRSAPATGK
jgi:hypothetical protein